MIQEQEKHSTRHRNTKISRKKTRAERRKRKRQKNNRNQFFNRKVYAHAIVVEILNIYFPDCTGAAYNQKGKW